MTHRTPSLVAVLLVGVSVSLLAASVGMADEVVHHEFLLGSKDEALRTEKGAEALAERLRARLRAAMLQSHKVAVDANRGEVRVEVFTEMSIEGVKAILVPRGQVTLLPTSLDVKEFEDVAELLPKGVQVGRQSVGGQGGTDIFLFAKDEHLLKETVDKLSMWNYNILVGPVLKDDARVAGFRTWLIRQGEPGLGSAGLKAATIATGTHPNYHYVTIFWGDAPQKKGALTGMTGLYSLTRARVGGHLLLVVDGALAHVVEVTRVAESGQINILLPPGRAEDQLAQARRTAGLLGSRPHPCEIVVISASTRD